MPETYTTYASQPAFTRIGRAIYWITNSIVVLWILLGWLIAANHPGGWGLFLLLVPIPAFFVWLCGRLLKYLFSGL